MRIFGLDPVLIARELEELRVAYRIVHAFTEVSDLQPKQGIKRLQCSPAKGVRLT